MQVSSETSHSRDLIRRCRLLTVTALTIGVSLFGAQRAIAADGTFSGKVVLEGDAPTLAALIKKGQPGLKDAEVCGVADIADDSLVVGDDGGVANVFVFLRRAPKGYKGKAPSDPVVLDQKDCVFTPHVALIQAKQHVLVTSSDAVQHNVHTFPKRNDSTNLLIKPNEQDGIELVYRKAESGPIQVKCDIHSWMSSWHLVLDHPFMAVTDEKGEFTIEGLPEGKHQFRVWHERGGLLEKSLKVKVKGDTDPVTLKYDAATFE